MDEIIHRIDGEVRWTAAAFQTIVSAVYRTEGGYVSEERRHRPYAGERFDRVRFAMRALAVLRPCAMSVLVREGRHEITVEQGKYWDRPPGCTWAIVAIPPEASREQIVLALADITGATADPYILDVLMALPGTP